MLAACVVIVLITLGGIFYFVYDVHRQNNYRRGKRKDNATRVPKQIDVKQKKKTRPKLEPLEIDNGDDSPNT